VLPPQWRIHNVFHASLLTPYKETEEYGENFTQPPPELVEGQEEYEVEQIIDSRRWGRVRKLQYLLRWKGYSRAHDSWQDATEVHAPRLVKEYYARKKSAVRAMDIKGDGRPSANAPPLSVINCITMSNGSLSPASTFSFIYPTTDHEETPTAGTTNDNQYNDQVVLFGADGRWSIGPDPSLVDFDPLGVDIALCDAWYQPEAVYCNDTWWATLQDDGSEASESGSSDVPSRPRAPVNWAGPELPFFVPTRDTYPPDPRDAIESTIAPTPPHTPPLIGLTSTTATSLPTTHTIPTTTTCAHATANDGGHVDHTIRARDEARHHDRTHDGYIRTVTGSYHRGVGTTFIDDAPIGRVTKKRRNKNAVNHG
jgi:Chromo (CHRromatin Organisation MOdifier) domain